MILLLFAIPFISNLFGSNFVLASGQCLEDQKTLLLQLRNNFTYDSAFSNKLIHWNEISDCCDWPGVDCDDAGHVISLDLNSESISGGINDSSSLFELRFLERLNLAMNYFSEAELPSGFQNLHQLMYLNLSGLGFVGQIPYEFSLLTRLVVLDLSSHSSLLQLENPNLEMFVKNLSNLKEIYLDGVNVSTNRVDWSRVISSSLPDLTVLSLSNCYLSGPPESSLTKLRNLSVIHLDGNSFSTRVPDIFIHFLNLSVLTLSSCNFSGIIPQKVFQIPTLRVIDLSNNNGLEGSLPEFPINGLLQDLVLSYTNISGPLPDSISNLKMLSRVEVRSCKFSGQLPRYISNLTRLVYLDFSSNHFNGTIPSFIRSKNLTLLNFYDNDLTGEIPFSLWEGLDSLTFLDLSENSLTGKIPASLFSLRSLLTLTLSYNQFSGKIDEPKDVSSSGLESLHLSGNNLEGLLPRFFFTFRNLTALSISYNKLSGIIDLLDFKEFDYLSSLDLSYNNVSVMVSDIDAASTSLPQFNSLMLGSCNLRKIPPLRNQSKLMMLDLSNNRIASEVPNWIWDVGDGYLRLLNLSHNKFTRLQEPYRFRNLHFLDLHSNLLIGEIPLPPSTVAFVDFSSNEFVSSIPDEIGNHLSSAFYFSIANNEVSGTIPFSLCNASRLEVLDLSNNSLIGTIPSCLIEGSDNLAVLNLRRNNLTGNIPEISSLHSCGLQTLDLSWNRLEGRVPESLENCRNLEVVNLGNNKIADEFPCWLTKLSNLRVIVLRFNTFRGNVSCIEGSYSWPDLQIIDLASNNFSGCLPIESSANLKAMMVDENEATSELDHLRFRVMIGSQIYYQDSATVILKGQELELQKILTAFTSIDFSSNNFEGGISNVIGELNSLYLLNLSHNYLTGQIPPSIGKLQQLGSLDLSFNELDGEIPNEIGSLTFLSFLNLSYNHFLGMIPQGSQIQTFPESAFKGNEGLCGFPLNRTCDIGGEPEPPGLEEKQPFLDTEMYISGASGFAVGLGVIFGPPFYSRRWKAYCNKKIDWLITKILHQKYRRHGDSY